jgi:hypothetical protein
MNTFVINYFIQIYCLLHVSNKHVHPQEDLYMQFYGIFYAAKIPYDTLRRNIVELNQ